MVFSYKFSKEEMFMVINVTTLAAAITALGVILGAVFGIYKWFLKQEKIQLHSEPEGLQIKRKSFKDKPLTQRKYLQN